MSVVVGGGPSQDFIRRANRFWDHNEGSFETLKQEAEGFLENPNIASSANWTPLSNAMAPFLGKANGNDLLTLIGRPMSDRNVSVYSTASSGGTAAPTRPSTPPPIPVLSHEYDQKMAGPGDNPFWDEPNGAGDAASDRKDGAYPATAAAAAATPTPRANSASAAHHALSRRPEMNDLPPPIPVPRVTSVWDRLSPYLGNLRNINSRWIKGQAIHVMKYLKANPRWAAAYGAIALGATWYTESLAFGLMITSLLGIQLASDLEMQRERAATSLPMLPPLIPTSAGNAGSAGSSRPSRFAIDRPATDRDLMRNAKTAAADSPRGDRKSNDMSGFGFPNVGSGGSVGDYPVDDEYDDVQRAIAASMKDAPPLRPAQRAAAATAAAGIPAGRVNDNAFADYQAGAGEAGDEWGAALDMAPARSDMKSDRKKQPEVDPERLARYHEQRAHMETQLLLQRTARLPAAGSQNKD